MGFRASISREEEADLVRACVRGAPGQWGRFVEQYKRLIAATAASVQWKQAAPGCEVEDMVGQVYERLLEDRCKRLRAWRGESRLSTYLVKVTRNLCIDQLKKLANVQHAAEVSLDGVGDIPGPAGHSPGQAESEERDEAQRAALRDAIRRLPPRQAMMMRLRLRGKSLREIAGIMRIPEGTVFVENSRAIGSLREALQAREPERELR